MKDKPSAERTARQHAISFRVRAQARDNVSSMLTAPNIITLLRLVLVPIMAYYLLRGAYGIALLVFLIAAVSDVVDGYIARRFGLTSALGATLDPLVDKLNILVATLLLAWQLVMPLWLAIAIVVRDVVIVVGALAYHMAFGHVEIAPTRLSKVNTFFEFSVLLLVMAAAAGWIDPGKGRFMATAFLIVFATVVASGAQYVWLWGRKAISDSRAR
jgi:cardiolipin synthase